MVGNSRARVLTVEGKTVLSAGHMRTKLDAIGAEVVTLVAMAYSILEILER